MPRRRRTHDDLFTGYLAEMHRVVHAFGLFLDAQLDGALTQPEALVIATVHASGTTTINAVHRAFLHRRSTLTSVLDRLEAKGLLRRSVAGGDRRSVALRLTPRGARAAEAIAAAVAELRAGVATTHAVTEHEVAHARAIAECAAAMANERKQT